MSIEDQLDNEYADSWKPEHGDKLIGTVAELNERDSGYGPYPVLTLVVGPGSTQDGEPIEPGERRSFHAFHDVARRKLAKRAPKVGDALGVRYVGRLPGRVGARPATV